MTTNTRRLIPPKCVELLGLLDTLQTSLDALPMHELQWLGGRLAQHPTPSGLALALAMGNITVLRGVYEPGGRPRPQAFVEQHPMEADTTRLIPPRTVELLEVLETLRGALDKRLPHELEWFGGRLSQRPTPSGLAMAQALGYIAVLRDVRQEQHGRDTQPRDVVDQDVSSQERIARDR